MDNINTDLIIAISGAVTATGVLVMIYQSIIASRNLREFKKNAEYQKEKDKKIMAIKEIKKLDDVMNHDHKMFFATEIVDNLSLEDTKKLINSKSQKFQTNT